MFWFRLKQFLARSVSIPMWLLLLIAVLGLSGGATFWLLGPGQRPWLEVLKDKDGAIVGLHVEPRKIPRAVVDQLPSPGDNTPLRDKAEIKALAERYELYQSWEPNPHLAFEDWVIDYWSKQGRPAWELELQFLSRRLVLEAAERSQARIPSPGDLSKWAERIYPILLKKAQEK
jgi:hypothetical protein